MSQLVVLSPDGLTQEARATIQRRMEEWAKDRSRPLVLDGGMHLSTIGGLVFQCALVDGPLDKITFTINIPGLDALPEMFTVQGGRYVRWVDIDGIQMRTSDGGPCYRWEAA